MSTGYRGDLPPTTRVRRARILAIAAAVVFTAFGILFLSFSGDTPLFLLGGSATIVQAAIMILAVSRASAAIRALSIGVAVLAVAGGSAIAFTSSATDGGSGVASLFGLAAILAGEAFLVHMLSRAVEVHST